MAKKHAHERKGFAFQLVCERIGLNVTHASSPEEEVVVDVPDDVRRAENFPAELVYVLMELRVEVYEEEFGL